MIKEKRKNKSDENNSESGDIYSLILFNDEINTFEFVVQTLIEVCDHHEEQAYQCALVAHHNGKCEIKKGMKSDLKYRCNLMLKKGLNVEIV